MKSFKEHMLPMTMAKKNAIVGVREEDIEERLSSGLVWSIEVRPATIAGKKIKKQVVKVKAGKLHSAIKKVGKQLGVDWKLLDIGKTKKG